MADLPHKEHAVFYEVERRQRRRNLAAAFLAITSVPAGIQLPSSGLQLTAYAPTVTVSGSERPQQQSRPHYIERPTIQPRRPFAALYRSITSAPVAGGTIALPTPVLTILAYAPAVSQATPVFAGRDLQSEQDPEVWQPGRRNYLYAYSAPGANAVNLAPSALTLTAYPVTISLSGFVFLPTANLTLTSFAPTITQLNTGVVNLDLGNLTLNAYPIAIDISGPGRVDFPLAHLSMTAYDLSITQFTRDLEIKFARQSIKINLRRT